MLTRHWTGQKLPPHRHPPSPPRGWRCFTTLKYALKFQCFQRLTGRSWQGESGWRFLIFTVNSCSHECSHHGYTWERLTALEPLQLLALSNISLNHSFGNSKQLFLLSEHPMCQNCLKITHDGSVLWIVWQFERGRWIAVIFWQFWSKSTDLAKPKISFSETTFFNASQRFIA